MLKKVHFLVRNYIYDGPFFSLISSINLLHTRILDPSQHGSTSQFLLIFLFLILNTIYTTGDETITEGLADILSKLEAEQPPDYKPKVNKWSD